VGAGYLKGRKRVRNDFTAVLQDQVMLTALNHPRQLCPYLLGH
jgi:hypothetical protein